MSILKFISIKVSLPVNVMKKIKKQTEKEKVNWHRLWGLMMSPLFERLGCETIVELDLSIKIQRLDMVVVIKQEPFDYNLLKHEYYEGFENLNKHNLLSFKSFREVFNVFALEEFYGHFINYKKEKNISDDNIVNLYAITHHLPKELFERYENTGFLECIKENEVYDLKILTPVRFIITKNSKNPVLGLFSDSVNQIKISRERLEEDGWLIEQVSSYLGKLYNYYNLEGVNMPYTKEMFLKDNYPKIYGEILQAEKRGKSIGLQEGEKRGIINNILFTQETFNKKKYSKKTLESKTIQELQKIFVEILTKSK